MEIGFVLPKCMRAASGKSGSYWKRYYYTFRALRVASLPRFDLGEHRRQLGERLIGGAAALLGGRVDELVDLAAEVHDHFFLAPVRGGDAQAGDVAAFVAERLELGRRQGCLARAHQPEGIDLQERDHPGLV